MEHVVTTMSMSCGCSCSLAISDSTALHSDSRHSAMLAGMSVTGPSGPTYFGWMDLGRNVPVGDRPAFRKTCRRLQRVVAHEAALMQRHSLNALRRAHTAKEEWSSPFTYGAVLRWEGHTQGRLLSA
eukprot:351952-Chlamydomonas_euryale.AAC.9